MLGTKITLSLFALRHMIVAISIGSAAVLAFMLFVDVSSPVILLQGNSMAPAIKPGDLVFTYRQHISEVKVGDIIAANIISDPDGDRIDKKLFVHRVIERSVNEGGIIILTTKGDSLQYADKEKVTSGNYAGSVYFVLPRVSSVFSMLTNPLFFGLMIAGVITYFVFLRKITL